MTLNFLLEMEEKEYLIMRSVHTKIDDVTTTEPNLNPNQIWISRQAPFTTLDPGATINDVIREEEEEAESGFFCMSNVSVFHKSEHTASLSYWIGQLLSQNMVAGNQTFFRCNQSFEPLFQPSSHPPINPATLLIINLSAQLH